MALLDTTLTIVLTSGATLKLDTTFDEAVALVANHAAGRRRGFWTNGATSVRLRAVEAVSHMPRPEGRIFPPSPAAYVQAGT